MGRTRAIAALGAAVMAAAALCGAPLAAYAAADADPFRPKAAPTNEVRVAVKVLGNNMPLVEGTIDGRPCTLIFDTGATHTTFDLGFVKRELPQAKLEDVVLAGVTNVEKPPRLFHAGSLKLGDAVFGGFDVMALDIAHLGDGVGAKIDGILGVNVIGRVRSLVSLGGGEVFFAPAPERLDGFTVAARRFADDPMRIAFRARAGERPVEMIVDSASSFTFLDEAVGWPVEGEVRDFSAVDVNGSTGLAPRRGAPGELFAGIPLAVRPLVVKMPMNRIGSDTLQRYDMVVEPSRIAFRPYAKDQVK